MLERLPGFKIGRFNGAANPALLDTLWGGSAAFFLVVFGAYLSTLHWAGGWIFDFHHYLPGRDFLNLWMAGKLGLMPDPGQYYARTTYMAQVSALLGPGYQENQLSYPPTQFLLGVPFGLLPYGVAYGLWLALNLGALYAALRPVLSGRLYWLVAACPAGLIWLICGQSSLLSAALLFTAFRLLDRRPWVAGACIAGLIIKPHLAVLFPVLLLATGRWRAFFAACGALALIVAATVVWFGADVWLEYWRVGIPQQAEVAMYPSVIVSGLTPTMFNDWQFWGIGQDIAMNIQAVQTLLAALVLALGLRRDSRLPAAVQLVFFLSLSLLATPYLLAYDLVPFSLSLIYLTATVPLDRAGRILVLACLWLPMMDFVMNLQEIPAPSFLPMILVGWLWNTYRPLGLLPDQRDPIADDQPRGEF